MDGNRFFDYQGQAEAARKAKLDFYNYGADAEKKLKDVAWSSNRDEKARAWADWREIHSSQEFMNLLHAFVAATDAAYPPGFWEDFENLRNRTDAKALETAIAFLEADPYFFRSGYAKEKLLRYVRGYQLNSEDVARLQQVILNIVDGHYCREFREYCRLARKVDSKDFRLQLESRAKSDDANIRKRAQWVLDALTR